MGDGGGGGVDDVTRVKDTLFETHIYITMGAQNGVHEVE